MVFVFFDSETCTLAGKAFPVAYGFIVTDDRLVEVERGIVRTPEDIVSVFERVGKMGDGFTKIFAYNLHFDLRPLLGLLSYRYTFRFFAKSEHDYVSVSCFDRWEREVLRFCDLAALQRGGLAVCGRVAGLAKRSGDMDFTLTRSPDTPLTEDEQGYLMRDVEIMPAYLDKIGDIYGIPRDLFGDKIITVSQLARERARRLFGSVQLGRRGRSPETLQKITSQNQSAPDEDSLLLRRACSRGGLLFINAQYVGREVEGVSLYDFTSCYHFFIQSMRVPVFFKKADKGVLFEALSEVLSTPFFTKLGKPNRTFSVAFHMEIELVGLRLKAPYDVMGLGTFSKSKMAAVNIYNEGMASTVKVQDRDRRKRRDKTWKGVFLFEKLISADKARVHVTEYEAAILNMFYEWDGLEIIEGEVSRETILPPDWQAMRSLFLYEEKRISKKAFIEGYADAFTALNLSPEDIDAEAGRELYQNVKTEINTLFGELVRERRAPDWRHFSRGEDMPEIQLEKVKPYDGKEYGLYTQGMRITGAARLQLALLVDFCVKNGIEVLYGDTDSIAVIDNHRGDFERLRAFLNESREDVNRKTVERIERKTGMIFDNSGTGTLEKGEDFSVACFARPKTWGGVTKDARVILKTSGLRLRGLARHMESDIEKYPLSDVLGWNASYSKDLVKHVMKTHPPLFAEETIEGVDYRGEKFIVETPLCTVLKDDIGRAGNSEIHKGDIEILEALGNPQDVAMRLITREGIVRDDRIEA